MVPLTWEAKSSATSKMRLPMPRRWNFSNTLKSHTSGQPLPAKGPAGAWGSRVVYPATSGLGQQGGVPRRFSPPRRHQHFLYPFTLFLKIAFELGERLIPALGGKPLVIQPWAANPW